MDPGDTMDDDMEVLENEMSEILGTISWSHNLPCGEATQGKEVEEKQKWEQQQLSTLITFEPMDL